MRCPLEVSFLGMGGEIYRWKFVGWQQVRMVWKSVEKGGIEVRHGGKIPLLWAKFTENFR